MLALRVGLVWMENFVKGTFLNFPKAIAPRLSRGFSDRVRTKQKSKIVSNRPAPSHRYGGHFEFYCFRYLLWDAQGANTY